jgi:serine protease
VVRRDDAGCDGAVSAGATTCPAGASFVGYPTGGTLAGIIYDNSVASPSNATYVQLGQEAVKAAGLFGNTTAASNRYAQYVILSPSGTHPDGFNTPNGGFCAWHDWNGDLGVASSYGDIALTNMPYVLDLGPSCGQNFVNSGSAGTLDGFSTVNGHEYWKRSPTRTCSAAGSPRAARKRRRGAWIRPGKAPAERRHGDRNVRHAERGERHEPLRFTHPIVTGGRGGGSTASSASRPTR